MMSTFKSLGLAGIIFVLPLFASVVLPESSIASSLSAAENKEPKYKNVKTRKRASVGKTCAKALERVTREEGPIDSALWSEARSMLNDIERLPNVCISDNEQSALWNLLGYVNYSMNDVPEASSYYRKVVEGLGTPPEIKLETRSFLAKLYVIQEQYGLAVEQFEIWMDAAVVIGAEQRLMMAQLYYLFGRENEALEMTNLGIAEAEAKGIKLVDDFWKLQLSIYFQKKNYQKVKSLLKKLSKNNPDWVY